MYAIIDIETTGGSPQNEKITEIAVYLHDGEKIVEEYCSLINPEKKIPYHITALTGINNAMVADAPKFYEVARKIVELTEDKIFIAHNVSFDYQFIRHEFKRLGYDYSREKLCTVQLSRRLIPGLPSYSLGKICAELGIQIHGRHRASGDAYATVKLFEHLLSLSREEGTAVNQLASIDKQHLNPNLDLSCLQALPEEAGTYYFFNDQRELIYIGKSNNIRKRVYSHFRNYSSRKAIEMLNAIAEIDYELTGSELIALLRESDEIKKLKPLYNRAQRRAISVYGLYYFTDSNGYLRLVLDKSSKREEIPLISFPNLRSGKSYLNANILEYELCQKLCGLYPNSGACFSYEIAGCKGACIGKESPESYNKRAQDLINRFSYSHSSFFILDKGREDTEQGVVKIENGRYLGFGYADLQGEGNQITRLHSCIQSLEDNRDVQQIIRNYLARHPHIKIIPFNSHDES